MAVIEYSGNGDHRCMECDAKGPSPYLSHRIWCSAHPESQAQIRWLERAEAATDAAYERNRVAPWG